MYNTGNNEHGGGGDNCNMYLTEKKFVGIYKIGSKRT